MPTATGAAEEPCYVRQLFTTLLDTRELHIASRQTNYRNKITYSLPIVSDDAYSDLAADAINNVCHAVQEWSDSWHAVSAHILSKEDVEPVCVQSSVIFREIMVKSTRSGSILVRLTVQASGRGTDEYAGDPLAWPEASSFRGFLLTRFPSIDCLCYNVADESSTTRPSKEAPLHFLTKNKVVMEVTPNGVDYQIGPDTFSEVNHEVELLQWDKTKEWIEDIVTEHLKLPLSGGTTRLAKQKRILIVSGRDVSSFGLSFGSLRLPSDLFSPADAVTGSDDKLNGELGRMFDHVIAIQHCPLVHRDALRNFGRHEDKVKATVLHISKPDMVHGFEREISKHVCPITGQRPMVVGVMTGGRKGLDPAYIDYLVGNPCVVGIVYNSCATKSLIRDMQGLVHGGFAVDDFRSYDFLPGTGYTASLTKLMRRPRTLILPIGPAGVGKSCLASSLQNRASRFVWWHRDAIFASLRQQGVGLGKSKQLVHQSLLDCLHSLRNDNADDCLSASKPSIVLVDSTNGNAEARKLYVREAKPDLVVLVAFDMNGTDRDEMIHFLLGRTANRLGDNVAEHASFPGTISAQREKHGRIIQGMDYADIGEVDSLFEGTRSLVIRCDPRDERATESICYRVFLGWSVETSLRHLVLQPPSAW
jgi:predicted kinase